jgi:hypothetical protein
MGLIRALVDLNRQSREISRNWDPVAQAQNSMAAMQNAQHMMQRQTADLELSSIGTQGTATILTLADTGIRINDQPMIRLTLLVDHGGRPLYQATLETLLPLFAASQAGPGQRVTVLVHPYDPNRVLVRWGPV